MKLIFKRRYYVFGHLMFAEVIVLTLVHHLCNVCYFTSARQCISQVEVSFPPLYVCMYMYIYVCVCTEL
jgi:hypothetical protein